MLTLLNDRSPVEQFDVTGNFDFNDQIMPLEEFRKIALDARPDLKVAAQAVDKAKTDHRLAQANGSTDPTFGFDVGRNPPIDQYFGVSMNIPLRIFDRNQGEKRRTQLEIDRSQRLLEAAQVQVFSDVDSAYAAIESNLFCCCHTGKSTCSRRCGCAIPSHSLTSMAVRRLLDFLNAQSEYRSVQLSYVSLIGSYLTAASQLNLAVGREVVQ